MFVFIYGIDYFIVLKRQQQVNEKLFPHRQHSGVTTKTTTTTTTIVHANSTPTIRTNVTIPFPPQGRAHARECAQRAHLSL